MTPKTLNPTVPEKWLLIVEDCPVLGDLWATLCAGAGWETVVVQSVRAASSAMGQQPFSRLLTDFYLPDGDGAEVIARFNEAHPGGRAVLVTGSRESHVDEKIKNFQNVDTLHKPAKFVELKRVLSATG